MLLAAVAYSQLPTNENEEIKYRQAFEMQLSKSQMSSNAVMYVSKRIGAPKDYIQHHDTTAGKLLLADIQTAYKVAGKIVRIKYDALIEYNTGKCRITFYDIRCRLLNKTDDIYSKIESINLNQTQINDFNSMFAAEFNAFHEAMSYKDDF